MFDDEDVDKFDEDISVFVPVGGMAARVAKAAVASSDSMLLQLLYFDCFDMILFKISDTQFY